jgi:hypothetical protein
MSFGAAVLPVFVLLCVPRGSPRPVLPAALLLSPILTTAVVNVLQFRGERFSVVDVTLAVWAVLFISVPLVFVVAPVVPIMVFGAALWATRWRGRHRGAAALLVVVLAGTYWAWARMAP